jgi:hypothetical protein
VKNTFFLTLLNIIFLSFSFGLQRPEFETIRSKNFIVKYERGISQNEVKLVMSDLELQCKNWSKRLGLSPSRVGGNEVHIYKNDRRYFKESHALLKEEGCFSNGTIYLTSPSSLDKKGNRMNVISRIIVLSLLSSANDNGSPAWLTEAYGIYAGGDLEKYGSFSRVPRMNFRDLQQEYSQIRKEKDMKYFYAKLSEVMKFLIGRYGQQKVDSLFLTFDGIRPFEQVFEQAFSEKYESIEKAWANATRNQKVR